jgi:hypothetical protein
MGKKRTLKSSQFDFRMGKEASRIERDKYKLGPAPGTFTIGGPRKRIVRSAPPLDKYREKLKTKFFDFKLDKSRPSGYTSKRLLDYERQQKQDSSRSLLGKLPGVVDPDIDAYWKTLKRLRPLKKFAKDDAVALQKKIDTISREISSRVGRDQDVLISQKMATELVRDSVLEFAARCDDTPENHKMLPNVNRLNALVRLLRPVEDRGLLRKRPSKKKPSKKKATKKKAAKKKATKKKPFKKKYSKKKPKNI